MNCDYSWIILLFYTLDRKCYINVLRKWNGEKSKLFPVNSSSKRYKLVIYFHIIINVRYTFKNIHEGLLTRRIQLTGLKQIFQVYVTCCVSESGFYGATITYSRLAYAHYRQSGEKEIISFFCRLRWTLEETTVEKSKWSCNFLRASSTPLSKVFITDMESRQS